MGGMEARLGGMEACLGSLEASVNKNKENIVVLTGAVNKNTVRDQGEGCSPGRQSG